MRTGPFVVHGLAAGLGVFLVEVWPVALIWWAGTSGSVGDLSEVRFAGISLAWFVLVAAAAGWLTTRALRRAASSPHLARWDPWGAYALGLGVYTLALTAVPAIMYAVLLTDENESLRSREWLVMVLWIGGHLLAALAGAAAGRALLGRDDRPAPGRAPEPAEREPAPTDM